MKPTPVILTAFGSRQDSRKTRNFLEGRFRETFPDCSFHWAFASRSVQRHGDPHTPPPPEVLLRELAGQGHETVILQSLHVVCAAEFHRLLPLRRETSMKVRLGLPLLASLQDCHDAALAFKDLMDGLPGDTAAVLALHGSSHPGGAFFHLMGKVFMETWGKRAFYGMIEGQPDSLETASAIRAAGFSSARILPFTLVTGRHFEKDIAGKENSWRSHFLEKGVTPEIHAEGIGMLSAIADIFCSHLQKTLAESQGEGREKTPPPPQSLLTPQESP